MNILILILLGALTLWALHISSCREGRDTKGRFTKKAKKVVKPIFYSEFRKQVKLS